MQNQRLAIGAAVVAGLLTLGGVAGGVMPASAQTPGATPSATASARPNPEDRLAKLAANLGISVDQLKAGMKQTALQGIDDAVAAGRLTADQAAAAKQRVESGQGAFAPGGPGGPGRRGDHGAQHGPGKPGGPGGSHRGPGGPGAPGAPRGAGGPMAAAATVVGIDAQTLMTEMRSGKSLAQVAEAHGKTRDQLKTGLSQQFGQNLDALIDRVPPTRMQHAPGTPPTGTPQT